MSFTKYVQYSHNMWNFSKEFMWRCETDILASIAMIAITIISLILCLRRPFLKTR